MGRGPNVDQLRQAIDSGATGEKVAFPDPAAAPLGTDAEAAGHPPGALEVTMDLSASHHTEPRQEGDNGLLIYLGLLGVVMLAALVLVALA